MKLIKFKSPKNKKEEVANSPENIQVVSSAEMSRNKANNDPRMNTNYMAAMKSALEEGDISGAVNLNAQRNKKINDFRLPYRQYTNEDVYGMAKFYPKTLEPAEGKRIPSMYMVDWDKYKKNGESPATIPEKPVMIGNYDINTDFERLIQQAIAEGDYGKAQELERYRNQKIGMLGLDNPVTDRFNYLDPYQGELEAKKKRIEDREPFSYDYREDDLYKSILSQKEKEAEKAYKDGYAQLSRQFDGDIPVNMLNKLQATKGEIIDQADSYIPELRQLAYGMYQDEGNKMLRDYNLTQQAAAEDYGRWLANRDFIVSGNENAYARDVYNKEFDYAKSVDDRNFDYTKSVDDRNFDYAKSVDDRNFNYQKSIDERNFDYAKSVDDRNFNYAIERDAIADAWAQLEWEEELRRWNILHQ